MERRTEITQNVAIEQRIYEVLNGGEEGVVNLILSKEEAQEVKIKLENGRIKEKDIKNGKVNLITLTKDNLEVKIVDVKEFRDELFKRAEEFIREEREDLILEYPLDMEDVITNKVFPYIDIIGEDFMKRTDGTKYRGYIVKAEGEPNAFRLLKTFVALYEALIFAKNNKPYVTMKKLSEKGTMYTPNRKNYVTKEGTVTCLYNNLDRFMSVNKISDSDIVINDKSIKQFYTFDEIYFVTPTEKWVEEWWNYDCPKLYKFMPNIEGTTNMWGLGLVCWQNLLVESGWNYTHVDDDITEEEVSLFSKKYKNTEIGREMDNVLKSRTLTDKEKENNIKKVERIEKDIQEIIDTNEKDIILQTLKAFLSKDEFEYMKSENIKEMKTMISVLDGTMGLDCGFMYMSLTEGVELFKEVAKYGGANRSSNGAMILKYPINPQSTTIKRRMAGVISDIVEKTSNYRLTYWTILD